MITMRVDGLKELLGQLEQLGDALTTRRALARAVAKALAPVLADAKNRAPRDTGLLAHSLGITVKSPKDGDGVVVGGLKVARYKGKMGPARAADFSVKSRKKVRRLKRENWRQDAAWRFHFVETGTSKKPARPFVRPAFDSRTGEMLNLIKAELAAEIAKVVRKRARAAARGAR